MIIFTHMRIPWYIYAPLSLIVTCVTLFLCVKDNDITTPPSPEAIHNSVELWKAGYPISAESAQRVKEGIPADEPFSTITKPKPKQPEELKPEPVVPPEPVIDISRIALTEISPALDALIGQNFNTAQLAKYSDLMIQNNHPQQARIANERIMDSAKDATVADRQHAAANIKNLIPKTPLWNPDPSTRKKLNIELALSTEYIAQPEKIISLLKNIVINASDGTVYAEAKLTTGKNSSDSSLSSLRISADTPLVTFSIKEPADIENKIPAALYYAVRSKNNLVQKQITIPERPTDISARSALNTYITRQAWINATTSVTQEAAPTATEDTPSTQDIPE